jgi:bifunctional enzyme CysN/CysC
MGEDGVTAGALRALDSRASTNVVFQPGRLTRDRRVAALGARGATVLFTGLPGSGKSTMAAGVEEAVVSSGRPAFMLDGDNLRHGLNRDLGFSDADRCENMRRAGEVAQLFAESGSIALVSMICPFDNERRLIRALHVEAGLPFVEVYMDTPLEECERRDPKGFYARARAGQLPGFTGIDGDYEIPDDAELVLRPTSGTVPEQVAIVLRLLQRVTG